MRLTEHHDPAADDLAGQVLCDADLAILAAPPDRYDAYLAGVRRDYAHVSDTDFAAGRAAVLRDLAAPRPAVPHGVRPRALGAAARPAAQPRPGELERLCNPQV